MRTACALIGTYRMCFSHSNQHCIIESPEELSCEVYGICIHKLKHAVCVNMLGVPVQQYIYIITQTLDMYIRGHTQSSP